MSSCSNCARARIHTQGPPQGEVTGTPASLVHTHDSLDEVHLAGGALVDVAPRSGHILAAPDAEFAPQYVAEAHGAVHVGHIQGEPRSLCKMPSM